MFITMNFELADRFIPAFCSLSIIKWDGNEMVKQLNYIINPETNIEYFLSQRHKISNKDVMDKPKLTEIWHQVFDILENEIVVIDNATSFIKSLKKRADIDNLYMPDFKYVCMRSMFNKSCSKDPELKVNIPNLKELINVQTPNYNAFYDAVAIKKIVDYCMIENYATTLEDLYNENSFVIGAVQDQEILSKKEVLELYKDGEFFEE